MQTAEDFSTWPRTPALAQNCPVADAYVSPQWDHGFAPRPSHSNELPKVPFYQSAHFGSTVPDLAAENGGVIESYASAQQVAREP